MSTEAFNQRRGGNTFTRLAVTPEQIDALRLPTAPPKEGDRRRFHDNRTVQAEAIPPDVLAAILRGTTDQRIDQDTYRGVLDQEFRIREHLTEKLGLLLDEDAGGAP